MGYHKMHFSLRAKGESGESGKKVEWEKSILDKGHYKLLYPKTRWPLSHSRNRDPNN
jgi:hypothetical protein